MICICFFWDTLAQHPRRYIWRSLLFFWFFSILSESANFVRGESVRLVAGFFYGTVHRIEEIRKSERFQRTLELAEYKTVRVTDWNNKFGYAGLDCMRRSSQDRFLAFLQRFPCICFYSCWFSSIGITSKQPGGHDANIVQFWISSAVFRCSLNLAWGGGLWVCF